MAKRNINRQSPVYSTLINNGRENIATALLKIKNVKIDKPIELCKDNGTVFLKFTFKYDGKIYYVINSTNKLNAKNNVDTFILNFKKSTKYKNKDSNNVTNINVVINNNKTFFIKDEKEIEVKIQDSLDNEYDEDIELYKYVSFEPSLLCEKDYEKFKNENNDRAIQKINHSKVYFPKPNQLNDLYDGADYILQLYNYFIALGFNYSLIQNLCEKIESSKINKLANSDVISKAEELIKNETSDYKAELLNALKEFNTNDALYILSLTKQRNNILMWSHYGNSNKGICIGYKYDTLRKFVVKFTEKYTVFSGDVFYTNTIHKMKNINNIDYFFSKDLQQKISIISLAFFKSNHWNYEKEFRVAILKNKDVVFEQLQEIRPSSLTFGPLWSNEEINEFLKIINKNIKIEIFKSYVDSKNYNIILKKIN